MDLEDKFLAKVSGVQSLSSSVQSTPEKNGNSDDASRSPELLQEFLKSGPKKELLRTCFDKEKKHTASSKSKTTEVTKIGSKTIKKQESKKVSSSPNNQPSFKKQQRKGENPTQLVPASEQSSDFGCSNSWICKNSACRAVLSIDDTFCKRCSCCICHLFDDNKDPSLWLFCTSETGQGDSCGLSCHIECALQRDKVGVVDLGQLMQLDGSYCCASCGKISGILGCWKKQLIIAKDARRVDVLCYRIYLSYRLLDGTLRFKELHEMVKDAKAKLETGGSGEWCFSQDGTWATSSGIARVEKKHTKDPICVFPRAQRRILISNLRPCTEYTFRIVSYTDAGDWGHSEAKCFTKSIEIIHKNPISSVAVNGKNPNTQLGGGTSGSKRESKTTMSVNSSGFKVRELGKVLHLAWAQEQGCFEGFCSADTEKCCGASQVMKSETMEDQLPSVSRGLDLNVVSVPDLNEELTPPFESSRDEDNGCTLEQAVEVDDDAASHDIKKNGLARSNGSGDSQTWTDGPSAEEPAVDSGAELCRKRAAHSNEEMNDCVSTLINGSPFRVSNGSGCLDDNFEDCVKIIRMLECEGHINQEFRLKLLTWFSLRSTEQERRVVNTFIQTLMDDHSSLAGQLVDSFSDIISSKRSRNGFCSKLWH
ncbi:hypothetical protein GH714_033573 [Hevea brasiliensis]|uniref:Uncharacterized protein n=1 Tax=Hevea brasiliensis TaxID=3981 RepID=A0A6A6LSY2_HEVBR|nr:hypothetical protein GH714_033573 [Hevea brasiliensis]